MTCGDSILFPNLFPYGSYSAVSLIDEQHFVEIGTASPSSYRDSFVNCSRYLSRVLESDREAVYTAVTQNHLPSAGGSLVHPHLQVHADKVPSNHHRFLLERAETFWERTGRLLLSEYFRLEEESGARWIGRTGVWSWLAAFAPEGFFEVWGLLPNAFSLRSVSERGWFDLARGVCLVQRLYRSLNRNGYNLGLLSVEAPESALELRAVLLVRSNYAPWVRSDFTGFEVMLGDMATFTAPEDLAAQARPFFAESLE
jgi:galactose-1-phosphate uridylyltransferase